MNDAIRQVTHAQNIRYDKEAEALYIIDQSLLPNEDGALRPSASARPTVSTSWPAPSPRRTPPRFRSVCGRIPPG